jgi:hypothetical protein
MKEAPAAPAFSCREQSRHYAAEFRIARERSLCVLSKRSQSHLSLVVT